MKGAAVRLALALLCLLLLCGSVCAAGTEIDTLQAQATVDEQGDCLVTLTVKVSFRDSPEQFVIPLASGAREIELAGWRYRTRRYNGVTCLVVSNEAGFSGEQTFVCSYRLNRTVSETDGGQRFTLQLPEYGWACGIASYRLTLSFPTEVTSAGTWSSGYYSDIFDNYLDIQVEGNTLTAQSNTPMRDAETVTLLLDFPADAFDLRNQPGKTVAVDRLVFYLLLLLALGYWLLRLRNPLPRRGLVRSTSMETTAGEVPCQLFGERPDMAALLAHWGNLGYLQIHRSRERIRITRRMEMGNERKPAERRLFQALFAAGTTCEVGSIRFDRALRAAEESIRAAWRVRLFHPRSGNPRLLRLLGVLAGMPVGMVIFDRTLPATGIRWLLLPLLALLPAALDALLQGGLLRLLHRRSAPALAVAAGAVLALCILASLGQCGGLMFLNLLLQAFCALATLFGGRRSAAGQERLLHLLHLRRFLRRADRIELQEMMQHDSQYFYQMLPYAEVMGVGRAFAAGFGNWRPEPCAWLHDERSTPTTARGFQQLYHAVMTAVRTRPQPTARPVARRR